jgi:hypothetical protein
MTTKKPQETATVTQLNPHRMQPAESKRTVWHVTTEAETPLDAVLDPKYWAGCASKMRSRDRIEVEAEEGTYFAELMVLDVGRASAQVVLMRKVEFKANTVSGADLGDFEVTWRGVDKKWCVVRKSDKRVQRDGLETKQQAVNWATEHLKTIAA